MVRVRTLVVPSAVVVGLLIMGDSFLYSALPITAPALQLSLFQVSLLLSANRWVRLVSNVLVSRLLVHMPAHPLFAGAAGLGLLSTFLFTRPWGFLPWLAARAAWGMAWSVFRQSAYLAVWTQPADTHGRHLGQWWGVVRLGSGLGVLLGGWILDRTGFARAMWSLAGLALIGAAASLGLRWPEPQARQEKAARTAGPEAWRATWQGIRHTPRLWWLFLLGAGSHLILALVVALMSLYLQTRLGPVAEHLGLGVVAGLILALHWTSQIVSAPVMGEISDHLGRTRAIILSTCLTALALGGAALAQGYAALLSAGLAMLLFSGVRVAVDVAASELALGEAHPPLIMGAFATADDWAAAMGPILGLAWFRPALFPVLFAGCAIGLLGLALGYARSGRRPSQPRPVP